MSTNFPDDDDGDALRGVAESGADMSRPMVIDFQVAMPDEASAVELAELIAPLGFEVDVYDSPGCALPWTCECSKEMLATYDGVIAVQRQLAELSKPLGGFPDGWGTFGNT